MHELGLCTSIVDAVERRAGTRPVAHVRVRVGQPAPRAPGRVRPVVRPGRRGHRGRGRRARSWSSSPCGLGA